MTSNYEKVAIALQYLSANFKEQPSLDDVAERVHLSPFHFQRLFTEWAGVSPKKFLQFLTIDYARNVLRTKQSTLFDTAFETGLSGTGRLHDLFVSIEGMTPGEYKNEGENLEINYSFQDSVFGTYLIASTSKGICSLSFCENQTLAENDLLHQWGKAKFSRREDENQGLVKQFFSSEKNLDSTQNLSSEKNLSSVQNLSSEKIRLHLKGSPFQLKVWEGLLTIPEGSLTSYGNIASGIGAGLASRAVGTAIGSNPIGYLIPCHRVIRGLGGIGGYRWGITRKQAMIGWEASRVYGEAVNETTLGAK